jgi:hypothetical protein
MNGRAIVMPSFSSGLDSTETCPYYPEVRAAGRYPVPSVCRSSRVNKILASLLLA